MFQRVNKCKHDLHESLKGFNRLTFHSLSTRDNLRVFIVTEWLLMIERVKSHVDVGRDYRVNDDLLIKRTHLSSQWE